MVAGAVRMLEVGSLAKSRSGRRAGVRTLGRVAALLAGLLAAACARPTPGLPPPSSPPSLVPGLEDLGSEDDIDALALAAEPAGVLHLAWREVLHDEPGSGLPTYRVRAARGRGRPRSWSAPAPVPAVGGEPPRLVAAAGRLHLLAGPRLHHLVVDPQSGGWLDLGPLLPPGERPALSFDVASRGGDLVVAYAVSGDGGGEAHLQAVRWSESGAGTPRRVASVAEGLLTSSAPRLLPAAGELLLLWAVNGEVEEGRRSGGGGARVFSSRGRVLALRSGDGGSAWSQALELTAGGGPFSFIQSLDAAASRQGAVAFFDSFGLHASRFTGGAWAPPVRLAAYDPSFFGGGTGTSSVTAARCPGGDAAVAWVDERFRASDRRWWNPLGGVPWSDSPDWANNDLFVLAGEDLDAALAGAAVSPRRQTAPLSFTRQARLATVEGSLALAWTGRQQVGKTVTSEGEPPRIFLRTISCGTPSAR